MVTQKVEKDIKKWIIFNMEIKDFEKLYDLYKAVDKLKSHRSVTIEEQLNEDGELELYKLSQEGVETSIELLEESNKKEFLDYLNEHFLNGENLQDWYNRKRTQSEKVLNFSSNDEYKNYINDNEEGRFKTHPKEKLYYKLRVFFSGFIYLIFCGILAYLISDSPMMSWFIISNALFGLLFLWLMRKIAHGIIIGNLKGSSIPVTERQFPEIFEIVKKQSEVLKLKKMPEIYSGHGHYNAFVTRFARKNFLMIYSEVLETAKHGNMDVVKFVIAHELGHIKRNHLRKESWLWPSRFIPFLGMAYSRACEYTCDRIGKSFSTSGAEEGVIIMASGKEIYTSVNPEQYLKDAMDKRDFWTWLSEKFSSHPHTFKRLNEIRE